MARSKRAIRDHTMLILIAIIFGTVSLFPLSFWLWHRAVNYAHEKGPEIVQKRLSHLLAGPVTLETITLTFPPKISLTNFKAIPNGDANSEIKAAHLEVSFSIFALLSGKIQPNDIRIIAPDINLVLTEKNSFSNGYAAAFSTLSTRARKQEKYNWPANMKPSSWPIIINPERVFISDGRVHIEDERDKIPQIDGRIDLTIHRFDKPGELGIKSGNLIFKESSFFYHGLKGKAFGTVKFSSTSKTISIHCQPEGGGTLNIQTQIADSVAAPTFSFEITADSYDLKNLALLKFPFIFPPKETEIIGNFRSSTPLLYGNQLDSFSANITRHKGEWSINAINMTLLNNQGTVSGSVTPIQNEPPSMAKIDLYYEGKTTPDIHTNDLQLARLIKELWSAPIFISTEMNIDLTSYPLQATGIKVTSSFGDIFAKGTLDLLSGFIDMQGTYLGLPSSEKQSSSDIQSRAAKVEMSGIISHPDITVQEGVK